MSAAGSNGAARRSAAMRSRAGRTLVAVLGITSVTLTAAAAEPLGPRSTADVFAVGEAGLGSIDMLTLDQDDADGADGTAAGQGRTREGGSTGTRLAGSEDGLGLGLGLGAGPGYGRDGAVEIPVLGDETFASVIPSGLGNAAGIPAATLRAYRAAAETMAREAPGCRIDWALLAGIGRVEANHGRFGGATVSDQGVSVPRILGVRLDGSLDGTMVIRDSDGGVLDGDTAYDRALGPMQFLPGTWAKWGSDGDRDGTSNPQDIDDAALAAARYLCEGRSGLDDRSQAALAVRRYNNSSSYVELVLSTAERYRTGGPGLGSPTGPGGPAADPSVWSPFSGSAPPPGWQLPPGTVVGSGTPEQPPGSADPVPGAPSGPGAPVAPSTDGSTPATPPSGGPTPTAPPSGSPSTPPSGSPSTPPSSSAPTVSPTSPTSSPAPSAEPSATPTAEPSAAPSAGPSATLTVAPTCTPAPTEPGGTEPSLPAVTEPTVTPTVVPCTSVPSPGPQG